MTISRHNVPVNELNVFWCRSHFIGFDEVTVHHYLLNYRPVFLLMSILVPPVCINKVFPYPNNADKDHDSIAEDCSCEHPAIRRIQRFISMIACKANYDSRKDQVH